jgi:hypothetical protein
MKKFVYFIICLLIHEGCTNYYVSKFPIKNPTFYTFDESLKEIRHIIKNKFNNFNFKNCYPDGKFAKFVHMEVIFADEYEARYLTLCLPDSIIKTLTANDVVLTSDYDRVGNSSVYFLGNKGAVYFATFIIRLKEIDSNQTKVEIETYNPRIYAGGRFWDFIFITHPAPANHKTVEPTTIEEYEILLTIGEALGVKENMPKMNLPEKNK